MTRRRRITDSDAEALLRGHTPPDRADLAATASFLRELPAQLSESEPIELAPPRRRIRLLVAVAATVAAVVGLAGVVSLRRGEGVVRPAVGGEASTETEVTTSGPPPTTMSAGAPAATITSPPDSPVARYTAALLAWDQCVILKGQAACGEPPVPADYGVVVPTTVPASNSSPTTR